ncbi:MAG: MFS transporter [Chlamydiae bacterium]|nr:MFS transporter [Chlamydiota bacterium]MBI3265572.1 MFS transporter [Chlamydiota bacterium]
MKKSGSLFTVFLAVLIDLMGFGIILPLLPFYASAFHATPLQVGLLYSIYSLSQLVFSPLWGGLSDHVGRRPIMLVSTLGAAAAYLLFAFSRSLGLLFISRMLAGVMGGNISTAQAYVVDVTTPEDRAKGMGLIGAAFGIGFVVGPAVASLLIHPKFIHFFHFTQEYRFAIPGFFAAFLSLSSFLLVFFKLPETVTQEKIREKNEKLVKVSVFSKAFWQSILPQEAHHNRLPKLILSLFLIIFAQANLYSAFPLFCSQKLHLTAEEVGIFFALMGMIAVIIQGGLIKHLTQKFSEEKLFLLGNILLMIGLFLIPLSTSKSSLLLFLSIMSLGGSLNVPTLNSLISKESDARKAGAMMGTSQGIASLARVLGPSWAGLLYHFSFRLPYFVTASFISVPILIGWGLRRVKGQGSRKTKKHRFLDP